MRKLLVPLVSRSIVSFFERLKSNIGGDGVAAYMIRGIGAGALLKIFNMVLTIVTAIALTRMLGAREYGVYVYAISWVTLLGAFAKAGIDQVVVRNISIYRQNGDWAHIRGIMRFSTLLVLAAGMCCATFLLGVGQIFYQGVPQMKVALWIAALILPLQALLSPLGAIQQGFGKLIYAQVPTLFILPAMFFLFVVGVYFVFPTLFDADVAIYLRVLSTLVSVIAALSFLRTGQAYIDLQASIPVPRFQMRIWLSSALPLILMGSMFMVNSNADILMLGSMAGPEAAGIYKAATRGAELLTYGSAIVSAPLAPVIARLYAAGDLLRLQHQARSWGLIAFLPTVLLAAIFIFEGRAVLSLFGAEFAGVDANRALIMLSLGQVFLVSTGPASLLLVMTGHEKLAAQSLGIGAVTNVVLNAILIPVCGILGSATATSASTVIFAILLLWHVERKIGVRVSAFSGWFKRI